MVKKRTFKTSDFKVSALEWGKASNPKVLALHGWLDNANSFLPLAPYLKEFHVIAIDLIGHGLTEHRPKGAIYHFVDAVPFVHDVLDSLQWDKCSLLGHSMGGGISVLAAGTFPKRIEKLALIEALGPFSRKAEESPQYLMKHIESTKLLGQKKMPTYSKKEEAAIARKAAGDFSIETSRVLCERGLKKIGPKWTWRSDPRLRIESPLRMSEEQVQAYIRRIACPTVLIVGKNGLRFDVELMEARKKLVRDLKFYELEGGHHLHMETPKEVAEIVANSLK